VVTGDDIRAIVRGLPRSYEVVVRDRVKWRVGRIVYLALSRDETVLGFAFPRDERAAVLAAEADLFLPPSPSDERYQWLQVRMDVLDVQRLEELVLDAWTMVVPKSVSNAWFTNSGSSPGR
jgi:hypothetical protein